MVLVIRGHARSGTTMLWKLCNQHPDIRLTYEFKQFYPLGKPFREYEGELLGYMSHRGIYENRVLGLPDTGNKLLRGINVLCSYVFAARYLFRLRRYRLARIDAAAVEATLKSLFPQVRVVGDKYPNYVFMLDKLTEVDGLSCLIIYRDCRDVTSSTLKRVRTDWRNKSWATRINSAEKVAMQWVRAVELMEHDAGRIKMTRYEDLIQQPELELEALGNWLGVDPSGFPKELIRDASIGNYKSGLTDEEVTSVMKIAGPTMTRLGYRWSY